MVHAGGRLRFRLKLEIDALVGLFGVPVGQADGLRCRRALRQQHQQLFDVGLVGDGNLVDADQVGQQDRQRRLQPVEQLPHLVGRRAGLLQ